MPGEVFYDAEDDILETISDDDAKNICSDNLSLDDDSPLRLSSKFTISSRTNVDKNDVQHTPPPSSGPYKRRKVTNSIAPSLEVGMCSEGIMNSEMYPNNYEYAVEATQYMDVLILFRFNDHDLPFTLRKVIMSDLRLLTLLEAGLPSWVIFLQSYPVFCHVYRPWMCPLARALYVLISVVTVLIGFYDLYKNVPVLKATASRLFGPLFDWIETWEMITRIKYLGTMLFLHNFQKAVKWFLTIRSTTRSFLSVLTQPLAEPLVQVFEFLLPVSNALIEVVERFFAAVWILIGSSCSLVEYLAEMFLFPIWFVVSVIWSVGRSPAVLHSHVLFVLICHQFFFFLEVLLLHYSISYSCSCFVICSNVNFMSYNLGPLGITLCSNSCGFCIGKSHSFCLYLYIWDAWRNMGVY